MLGDFLQLISIACKSELTGVQTAMGRGNPNNHGTGTIILDGDSQFPPIRAAYDAGIVTVESGITIRDGNGIVGERGSVWGTGRGHGFDLIMRGTISANLTAGFVPADNDTFRFLTFNSRSSFFRSLASRWI